MSTSQMPVSAALYKSRRSAVRILRIFGESGLLLLAVGLEMVSMSFAFFSPPSSAPELLVPRRRLRPASCNRSSTACCLLAWFIYTGVRRSLVRVHIFIPSPYTVFIIRSSMHHLTASPSSPSLRANTTNVRDRRRHQQSSRDRLSSSGDAITLLHLLFLYKLPTRLHSYSIHT